MNILIVSHGIPSKEDPQWGCFEVDQAKALSRLGHRVIIIALDGRYRMRFRHIGITFSKLSDIDTYLYYLFPLSFIPTRRGRNWLRNKMMRRLYKRVAKISGEPDIIYAHYLLRMTSLSLVKKENPQIPIVGIEHWSELNKPSLSRSMVESGRIAYQVADRLLAVSPSLQDQIKKHFGKDSEVVYDMVDETFLQADLVSRPGTDAPFVFASCGSLIPRKGFDVLLKAFAKTEDKNSKLIILGDGSEKANLQELAETLGISARVDFRGMVSREGIAEVYAHSSAYALATRAETFGVSYIEAMAMGLPVIATRCGGPEHFVTDQCGYLLEVDDEDALVAAMNSIQKEYDRFDPAGIREYVRSRFSGEEIARQLEQIFAEEIEKKKQ